MPVAARSRLRSRVSAWAVVFARSARSSARSSAKERSEGVTLVVLRYYIDICTTTILTGL